jgi:hypothetical protein
MPARPRCRGRSRAAGCRSCSAVSRRTGWSVVRPSISRRWYSQSEFFVDGVAAAYSPRVRRSPATAAGRSGRRGGPVRDPGGGEPAVGDRDFNGTVVVSGSTSRAGRMPVGLDTSSAIHQGYAWVGVSAQAVGLNGLKKRHRRAMPTVRVLDPSGDSLLRHVRRQARRSVTTRTWCSVACSPTTDRGRRSQWRTPGHLHRRSAPLVGSDAFRCTVVAPRCGRQAPLPVVSTPCRVDPGRPRRSGAGLQPRRTPAPCSPPARPRTTGCGRWQNGT